MSIYHLDISNVSRAVNGNAVSTLAYISGDEIEDEMTGQKVKYKREDEVLAKKNIVPDDAPQRYKESAANWCNDIEKFEKAENARTVKRIRMALPVEMTLEEQQAAIDTWIEENCTKYGYPATYAIHAGKLPKDDEEEEEQRKQSESENDKGKGKGKIRNRHVHIIVGNRPLVNGHWATIKNKKVYELDEYGERVPKLAKDDNGNLIPVIGKDGEQIKDKYDRPVWKQLEKTGKDGRTRKQWKRKTVTQNRLDKLSTLKDMRKSWAEVCNKYLDPEYQIDHRSNAERGLDQLPTRHEGYQARAIEERGGVADVCEDNRRIKAINEELPKLDAKIANQKYNIMLERGKLDKLKAQYQQLSGFGKGGGLAGQAMSAAKGVAGAIKSAPGQLLNVLGGPDGEGGLDKALSQTAESVAKSLVQLDFAGAAKSVAELPLAVLKNVESDDVKRDKLREQMEKAEAESIIPGGKSKKKDKGSKGKGKGQAEHAPLVRSRGGR